MCKPEIMPVVQSQMHEPKNKRDIGDQKLEKVLKKLCTERLMHSRKINDNKATHWVYKQENGHKQLIILSLKKTRKRMNREQRNKNKKK